jgi:hypothetical protein
MSAAPKWRVEAKNPVEDPYAEFNFYVVSGWDHENNWHAEAGFESFEHAAEYAERLNGRDEAR